MLNISGRVDRKGQSDLLLFAFAFVAQVLPGAGDGIALLVQELLDANDALYVAAAVHPLAGAAFDWFQLWELGLPESQHVGRQTAQARDFTNPEIKLLRNQDLARFLRLSVVLFPGTHVACEKGRGFSRKARIPVSAVSSTMRVSEQPQFVLFSRRSSVVGRQRRVFNLLESLLALCAMTIQHRSSQVLTWKSSLRARDWRP